MFCGTFASGVAALCFYRQGDAIFHLNARPKWGRVSLWGARVLVVVLVGLAILAPFYPKPFSAESRLIEVPKLPPFEYSVPEKMVSAHTLQWQLATQRSLGSASDNAITLSESGRWLAYVPSPGHSLRVLDLHSSEVKAELPVPFDLEGISFSPQNDYVFATSAREPRQIGLFDLKNQRFIRLPKPKKYAVPGGKPVWWSDKDVAFGGSRFDMMILNLEDLELDKASDHPGWRQASSSIQSAVQEALGFEPVPTGKWSWVFRPAILSAETPETEGTSLWPIQYKKCLGVEDPTRNCRVLFPHITVEGGDVFFNSKDGSKVIRVRQGSLDAFYFDVGSVPTTVWQVKMPHGPESCPEKADVERLLRVGQLRALVSAPMVNPFNHQIVGPDRQRVKAVVSFLSWSGTDAKVYLTTQAAPIVGGDIVADVCALELKETRLFRTSGAHRWWTPLPASASAGSSVESVPTYSAISKQEDDFRREMEEREKAAAIKAKETAPKLVEHPPSVAPSQPTPSSLPERSAESAMRSVQKEIDTFLASHHQKATNKDFTAFSQDYAERADYLQHGSVDRYAIFQSQFEYHKNYRSVQESMVGSAKITTLPNGRLQAVYLMQNSWEKVANRQRGFGQFDITVDLERTAEGWKILKQRSTKRP